MYLSNELINKSVTTIQEVLPNSGKSAKERVSALSRFLACANLIQANNGRPISLAVGSPDRKGLIEAVAEVIRIGTDGQHTPDFHSKTYSQDYNLGSNFLTTTVSQSRDRIMEYPGRPAPLLTLDNENASIHTDFKSNLNQKYDFEKIHAAISIWLCRNVEFTQDESDMIGIINNHLVSRYGTLVGGFLRLTEDDLLGFAASIRTKLSNDASQTEDFFEMLSAEIDAGIPAIAKNSLISRSTGGENLIYYGAPGTGKSHTVDAISAGHTCIRTVFHPDVQNSDFVGALKPVMKGERVTYSFSPGPFAIALSSALSGPDRKAFLVIEELNRAPAAAVFGDLFLLLDRDRQGASRYEVEFPTSEFKSWLSDSVGREINRLALPPNLWLLATMNSADQGVYPIDTAFRRRWRQEYVPIDYSVAPSGALDIVLGDGSIQSLPWHVFAKTINDHLTKQLDIAEDRLLGPWFVTAEDLARSSVVPGKVLIYLWDDLLRHHGREKVFDVSAVKTFGEVAARVAASQQIFSDALLAKFSGGKPASGT